ncbi:homeodomain-like protein [Artemisia annua]|uniref:Homeodomain-like protein n=1 Tax=Artemisia annua TaxID=35608 RepID=A0A2U1NIG0_ARTAN|nr:homeodomain-like protein [Artemisia annua]
MGIDPITHKSKTGANTNVSHMTQWENVRLEAEARSARGCRVVSDCYNQRIQSTNIINKSSMSSILVPQPLCFDVLKGWQGINSCKLSSGLPTLDDQTMPIVNVVESVEPQALEGMTTEYHMNDWKTSTEFFNTIENPKNTLEVSDMIFKDNYLAEASINHLVNGASNGNCHGDFEGDSSYWRKILENLGHGSSCSSFF